MPADNYLRANFRLFSGGVVIPAPAGTQGACSSWISDYGTFLALPSGLLLMSADYSMLYLYVGTKFYRVAKDGTS